MFFYCLAKQAPRYSTRFLTNQQLNIAQWLSGFRIKKAEKEDETISSKTETRIAHSKFNINVSESQQSSNKDDLRCCRSHKSLLFKKEQQQNCQLENQLFQNFNFDELINGHIQSANNSYNWPIQSTNINHSHTNSYKHNMSHQRPSFSYSTVVQVARDVRLQPGLQSCGSVDINEAIYTHVVRLARGDGEFQQLATLCSEVLEEREQAELSSIWEEQAELTDLRNQSIMGED